MFNHSNFNYDHFDELSALSDQRADLAVHTFKPGDVIKGFFSHIEPRQGLHGEGEIVVLFDKSKNPIRIWHNTFIKNALEGFKTQHGDFVKISCSGYVETEEGRSYPRLQVNVLDGETGRRKSLKLMLES